MKVSDEGQGAGNKPAWEREQSACPLPIEEEYGSPTTSAFSDGNIANDRGLIMVLPKSQSPPSKTAADVDADSASMNRLFYRCRAAAYLFAICLSLFLYICCLSNISSAFSLLGSKGLARVIQQSPLINDPISAVVVGMLATVILQSPQTTINVLVSMVAANMITVHDAIPVMIGSELGSSLVNGLVSIAYSSDPQQFEQAFAAATLGDNFNICCLFIILPIELVTGVLETVSWWIVDPLVSEKGLKFKTIELLTDPVNNLILQVNDEELRNASLYPEMFDEHHTFVLRCVFNNGSRIYDCPYRHIFAYTYMTDRTIGWIVLISSITILIFCLISIVHSIQKLLDEKASNSVRQLLSKECPGCLKPCTGYTVLLVGLLVTLLLQSNSIFNSSLTPMVGSGVVTLEQMYPLVMGSNIGGSFSGVLAALSADSSRFEKSLHMAMCQVLYNIFGTLMFYVVPATRQLPIYMSRRLGQIENEYRWFIVVFILLFFVIVPAFVILLTFLPDFIIVGVFTLILILTVIFAIICYLQKIAPQMLPTWLWDWKILPKPLRSLKPYDPLMTKIFSNIPFIGGFFDKPYSIDKIGRKKSVIEENIDKLIRLSRNTQV